MQRRSFVHQPALDGVRAVAVIMVLLFHAGLTFLPAGYLGVSVFFTLSGYLITGLLVAEHGSTGRVDLGAFWSRRLRRLLPASLLCIGSIAVARQFGAFSRVDGLRDDIAGA
ncbi:MAG: putative acyltransferase, partial [Ilumatobacteraceae bacterium]|nr:putative acyltransferase [Ilumatobacteraceae bacterium]